jgi:hypothetical protein
MINKQGCEKPLHGNVIYVPTNVDQIQSILPCLPHDNATIGVFLK